MINRILKLKVRLQIRIKNNFLELYYPIPMPGLIRQSIFQDTTTGPSFSVTPLKAKERSFSIITKFTQRELCTKVGMLEYYFLILLYEGEL